MPDANTRADRAWRAERYAARNSEGYYLYTEVALNYLCSKRDYIACAELDRRKRKAMAVGKRPRVAREILMTRPERRQRQFAELVDRLEQRQPDLPERTKLEIASTKLNRKRKRWKRR